MDKYFKEIEGEKFKLSEYLKMDKSEFKSYVFDEKYRDVRTKYIISIIGDVELERPIYELFLKQFQSFGGRYDVRTKPETIKGIYEIVKKYPCLTAYSLEEIWFVYISDLFDEYMLVDVLDKYIDFYGKIEVALCKYLDYVAQVAKKFDKQFEIEATKLDIYHEDYTADLINHLQYIIKSQHIQADKIISSLPDNKLVEKDVNQLEKIIKETRIYFGACYPICYQMIESLATGEGLDRYPEQPKYLINGSVEIDTTFTKQEFIDSIKKQKTKKL